MSQMNDLSVCISELRNAAKSLIAVADSLTELFSGEHVEEAPKQEAAPAPKPITKEEVRAVLRRKAPPVSARKSVRCSSRTTLRSYPT